jgi:predicted metal-dependent phosphoesterase TrpH
MKYDPFNTPTCNVGVFLRVIVRHSKSMKLKANLHFHSKEDPIDVVPYTLYEGIDYAAQLGFNVLASTCHTSFASTPEHVQYAHSKGILLIPGIEADIYETGTQRRNHIVILGCDKNIENVRTFDDLRVYKASHPEICIIAAHPLYPGTFSLGIRLEKYIDLFDAIEHSWFYTRFFNHNTKAIAIAKKYNKPIISTSDTHFFAFMDTNYAEIDTQTVTQEDVFNAIRSGSFTNITTPRSLFDIFGIYALQAVVMEVRKFARRIYAPQESMEQTSNTFMPASAMVKQSNETNHENKI